MPRCFAQSFWQEAASRNFTSSNIQNAALTTQSNDHSIETLFVESCAGACDVKREMRTATIMLHIDGAAVFPGRPWEHHVMSQRMHTSLLPQSCRMIACHR